jgi:hypothetical protein
LKHLRLRVVFIKHETSHGVDATTPGKVQVAQDAGHAAAAGTAALRGLLRLFFLPALEFAALQSHRKSFILFSWPPTLQ